jgi:hypothetical protein
MLTAAQADALCAKFPAAFGLRGFPGDTFRVSTAFSYVGDDGSIVVYTEIWRDGTWAAFAKGSVTKLAREVCAL